MNSLAIRAKNNAESDLDFVSHGPTARIAISAMESATDNAEAA